MPLGSSSAPVMMPGPRRWVRLFRVTAMENAALYRRFLPRAEELDLAERRGTIECADVAHMRHQPGARPPLMKGDRRRLHHHRKPRVFVQVEGRLMRRAGCDRGHGAGPAHLDRTMDVAAHGALDIAVAAHQIGEAPGSLEQARLVESLDAAVERR